MYYRNPFKSSMREFGEINTITQVYTLTQLINMSSPNASRLTIEGFMLFTHVLEVQIMFWLFLGNGDSHNAQSAHIQKMNVG